MERELLRLRGECGSLFAAGRIEKDKHRWSMPPCCIPLPETHVRWVLKLCLQRTPRERTMAGCTETTRRDRSMLWTATGGVHRKEPRSAIESPCTGPTIAASFSLCSWWAQLCL